MRGNRLLYGIAGRARTAGDARGVYRFCYGHAPDADTAATGAGGDKRLSKNIGSRGKEEVVWVLR